LWGKTELEKYFYLSLLPNSAPSEGTIYANGRIAAILELGMGFNPESLVDKTSTTQLTDGLCPKRIEERIPEIESFADIGDYFDQPLGVYSKRHADACGFALSTASRPQL
jgi:lipopolysaccharide transport system ATP-binding protein